MNVYCISQKFGDKVVAGKLFEASSDGDAVRSISISFRAVDPSLRDIMRSASLVRVGSFDEESLKLAGERKPVLVRQDLSVLCSFKDVEHVPKDSEHVSKEVKPDGC